MNETLFWFDSGGSKMYAVRGRRSTFMKTRQNLKQTSINFWQLQITETEAPNEHRND
jgi:hypothetical protein